MKSPYDTAVRNFGRKMIHTSAVNENLNAYNATEHDIKMPCTWSISDMNL